MNRPNTNEYAPYYQSYIESVDDDVINELETQANAFPEFLRAIPTDLHHFRYQPGKWSVKELAGHVIDTERIMAYRAFRFSRKDSTPLSGFDEEHYVRYARFEDRELDELAEEFHLVRRANMHFIRSLRETELVRTGLANGFSVSVRAILFIMAGHVNHHRRFLMERYLA